MSHEPHEPRRREVPDHVPDPPAGRTPEHAAGCVGAPGDLGALHPSDRALVETMDGVVRVYLNDSRWWQNASFVLPLLVAVLSLVVGALFSMGEATGFGLFAAAVTLIMLPVVLLTWRNTSTAIVLSRHGAHALHHGRVLHEAPWRDLRRIEEVEYLGNRRYKLVHGEDERFLSVETEIENREDLVETAFRLSGIPRQRTVAEEPAP